MERTATDRTSTPEEELDDGVEVVEDEILYYSEDDDEEQPKAEQGGERPAGAEGDPAADAAQVDTDDAGAGDGDAELATDDGPPAEAGRRESEAPPTGEEAPPEENAGEAEPLRLRFDKRDLEIPRGQIFTQRNPDGTPGERWVLFPESELRRTLQPHLADRGTFRQEKKELLERVAAAERHEDLVAARELTAKLYEVLETLSDDELADWREKFLASRAQWDTEVKGKAQEEQATARAAVTVEPDPVLLEIYQEEAEEQIRGSLGRELDALLGDQRFAGLQREGLLEEILERDAGRVLFVAAEDMPEYGLKEGDVGILRSELGKILTREAAKLEHFRSMAKPPAEVTRRNDAALGRTSTTRTPPTVSTRGTRTAPGGGRKPGGDDVDYKTWQREFLKGSAADE